MNTKLSYRNLRLLFAAVFAFGLFTLQANIVVLNGLAHEHFLDAGSTVQGTIKVKNNSEEDRAIIVYQRDLSFNYKGETFYEEGGTLNRSNASWLVINPLSLVLGPYQEAEILYEVYVPQNDSLRGSYWSAIMIEPAPDLDTSVIETGLKVQTIVRYAVQIACNIRDESSAASLKFLDVDFTKLEGKHYLKIDAENDGEKLLKTVMAVELFNAEGVSIGVFKSPKSSTYPGQSRRYIIEIPDSVEAGNYQALLIAESQDDEVFGVQLSLELEDD